MSEMGVSPAFIWVTRPYFYHTEGGEFLWCSQRPYYFRNRQQFCEKYMFTPNEIVLAQFALSFVYLRSPQTSEIATTGNPVG